MVVYRDMGPDGLAYDWPERGCESLKQVQNEVREQTEGSKQRE